jgi:beta-N-acetylhexosaminidase
VILAPPALVLAVAAVVLAGSPGRSPTYTPTGGPASVITPRARSARHRIPRSAPFKPVPAAVTLAATLPLERQVAQLFFVTPTGNDVGAATALGSRDWGGVVLTSSNFVTDGQIGALAADISAVARSAGHVAPLIAAAQDGGPSTALPDLPPEPEAVIGASGEPAVAGAQAMIAGTRLRELGIRMTLAPFADVDTPGGVLSGRLFSTDPAAVARFSSAAISGYARAGVIAAVGHFPGEGGASADPDQIPATVGGSLDQLRSRDLIPFAGIASRAPVILMSNASYAAFDGVTPAGLLRPAVQLLRRDYGFQGVVMSDDLDATLQATGEDAAAAAIQALRAGDDALYQSGPAIELRHAYDGLLRAAQGSASVRSAVHLALLRLLSLKARYGLI